MTGLLTPNVGGSTGGPGGTGTTTGGLDREDEPEIGVEEPGGGTSGVVGVQSPGEYAPDVVGDDQDDSQPHITVDPSDGSTGDSGGEEPELPEETPFRRKGAAPGTPGGAPEPSGSAPRTPSEQPGRGVEATPGGTDPGGESERHGGPSDEDGIPPALETGPGGGLPGFLDGVSLPVVALAAAGLVVAWRSGGGP